MCRNVPKVGHGRMLMEALAINESRHLVQCPAHAEAIVLVDALAVDGGWKRTSSFQVDLSRPKPGSSG